MQNASGYTRRQSHAAVWPRCETTWALLDPAAGVDLEPHTAQREIPQSNRLEISEKAGDTGGAAERDGGGGTMAGKEETERINRE